MTDHTSSAFHHWAQSVHVSDAGLACWLVAAFLLIAVVLIVACVKVSQVEANHGAIARGGRGLIVPSKQLDKIEGE
jgi:hypothetical protein